MKTIATILALLTSPTMATCLAQETITRVSVDSSGAQGNEASYFSSLSADRRFTAFMSRATNLVPGDTNNAVDVFAHDANTGETTRVSAGLSMAQANGTSRYCAISADGRFVAFSSLASNLVPGDTNGVTDVFVHDLATRETTRVSVDSASNQGNAVSGDTSAPAISADGRFVAFSSYATNLVAGDTNGAPDIFVHDRATGETRRVSVDSAGLEADGSSDLPSISGNGRWIAFVSAATNLVPGDTNQTYDVFVHDLITDVTIRASVGENGREGNSESLRPSLSFDGHFVAFDSLADNLVSGDTNAARDVFVRDLASGVTIRASVSSTGEQGDSESASPSISADGQRVAFDSRADNLVAHDTNAVRDIFVHDLGTLETTRANVSAFGAQANKNSLHASISGDGSLVAFYSVATDLVIGDTNGASDVFNARLAPVTLPPQGVLAEAKIWSAVKNGPIEYAWYHEWMTDVDTTFDVVAGIDNVGSRKVAQGLPVAGIAVSVADFGSGESYQRVGVYRSNLAIDPLGQTPDLSQPLVEAQSPPLFSPPLLEFVPIIGPSGAIPFGDTRVHAVVELYDDGLLDVGADSSSGASGGSGFSVDEYRTPSISLSFLDFGLNIGQDNTTTSSCRPADRAPHGRLRVSHLLQGIGEGDLLTATVRAGNTVDLAFFGPRVGDDLRFYGSLGPCAPALPLGPVLSTLADPDGTGSYLRVNATWPSGVGGQTLQFSAMWGNRACANPGVGFTNCVTIITKPDPQFGICDDGTIESGWVVQFPTGSSDYFNNSYGAPPASVNGVVGLTIAVLDFGTPVAAFPSAGISNANLAVDPSGNTPDLGAPLACVCPFTFPPGTFATTVQQYISHAVSVPGGALGPSVHGWVQFPPGDSGLLGVGGDSTETNHCSYYTMDGYTSPAVSFSVNWGLRIDTN